MLDYRLTEEEQMIRDLARKVALEKVLPKRAEWDETGEFPWEAMKAFADADLCGLTATATFIRSSCEAGSRGFGLPLGILPSRLPCLRHQADIARPIPAC